MKTWSFLFFLKPSLHFIPIKGTHEKSAFMGHTHRNTKLYSYGPVAFWQNGPENNMRKEYEERIMNVEGNCFYWFSLAVQFITQRLNLWNRLFWQNEKQATFRTQKVGSHILLIINFWVSVCFWRLNDKNQDKIEEIRSFKWTRKLLFLETSYTRS